MKGEKSNESDKSGKYGFWISVRNKFLYQVGRFAYALSFRANHFAFNMLIWNLMAVIIQALTGDFVKAGEFLVIMQIPYVAMYFIMKATGKWFTDKDLEELREMALELFEELDAETKTVEERKHNRSEK